MSKKWASIISSIYLIAGTTNIYANNQSEHYVFHYESGDTYDVSFTDNTVTWKGLKGNDKGKSETDLIKKKNISNNIEVIQWNETNGYFVTLVLNHESLKIISSLKAGNDSWFISGNAIIN